MGNLDNKNRVKGEYFVLKQPSTFVAENRGFSNCCEPFLTLVDEDSNASHRNDTNSAWSLGETVTFELKKGGVTTSYVPVAIPFPNETNAWYTTIEWRDVQFMDGYGVFELYMTVVSAGLTVTTLWAKYNVQPYQNASGYYLGKGTVRLKSIFNDVNTFEGINFTNAYVVDTLRLKGKFGYWNPLTDVDNVQYTDAEKVKIRREDLTEYELRVDLHGECVIDRLRFHLVSENACYITDHNGDNYTYKYLDYPVIVKSGFEPNWIDGTRKVKGVAKFEDKQKMTKTHFQDNDTNGKFNEPQKIALPATINDNGVIVYVPGGQYYETGSVIKDLYYKLLKDTYKGRVAFDSGTFEAESCLTPKFEEIGIDLLESASMIITPNGYKTGKLHAVKSFDGLSDLDVVRATGATRVNSAGLIESVASNVPRLDYSNGTCPSILVEPQRTNLVLYNQEFNNGYWTYAPTAFVTANSVNSPDGTLNADKLSETTFNGVHQIYSGVISTTASVANTYSVFAKKGERIWIRLQNGSTGAGNFNLNNGTIGTVSAGTTAKIEDYGDGWYRCQITFTASGSTDRFYVRLMTADNVTSYLGDGTSGVYLFGAQSEVGSYATSYIPTTSASVTRNADVISKTGISSLIGQTEGTLFVDYIWNNNDNSDAIPYFVEGNNGKLFWFRQGGIQFYGNSGALLFDYRPGATYNTRYKLAFVYGQNDFRLYINGTLASSSTSGTFSGTFNDLIFTPILGDTFGQSMKTNTLALWKTQLTNTQLAQLTTI